MRLLWLVVAVVFGCGPSLRETALAKTARYRGNEMVLFQRMVSAVESKYKLARIDQPALKLQTIARWYNPEGQGISAAGDINVFNIPDRSIRMALVAELLPVDKDWVVQVRAEMVRFRVGQTAPDRIFPNEILPGWIPGKVDQLQYEIYEALREYEVPEPSGNIAPPPAERPPVDPDEPPPGGDPVPAPPPPPPMTPAEGSALPP